MSSIILHKVLGRAEYGQTYTAMRLFTDSRLADSPDELWALEHPSVFTQGQAGKAEHILAPGDIPVVKTDRGGQVTYHGPGQLVVYLLVDLKRRKVGVRQVVSLIEGAIVDLLADQFGLLAEADPNAPGVYVQGRKIAALGLRVRRGCTFHGLSLNVNCDLEPFSRINPCGYQGMAVTSIQRECPHASLDFWSIGKQLQSELSSALLAVPQG